ncbi:HAD family acid phosphatase [Nocardioides sp.]|uniref:HAD family acid phosphatase n=1 Tax=Nocardioides sp. TaxID=35761 RepID=UPI002605E363|nr:HAD family acid phosphatase [Nocardioides sp.]MDI6910097.1 HAD family acid phosphatase [Nocardioides sp.]
MRNSGRAGARAVVAATSVLTVLVTTGAAADARTVDDSTLTPHTHFVVHPLNPDGSTPAPAANGESIPNIDSVKSTIRKYYNASSAGIADKTSSPYITEMTGIEQAILSQLPDPAPAPNLAVVLDADDTTLWTYDMEDGAMHFNFDPKVQNDDWVVPGKFPATPGMVDFVNEVQDRGYQVFGITGRGEAQEQATLDNLTKVGYDEFDADNFYTKPATLPDYLDCHASVDPNDDPAKCSTVEYKAGTRAHIESLGYTIALNIGDQYSDLQGGHALNTVKLPNPTYYLPSPNVQGAPAGDADLVLPTQFDMAADGSSGLTTPGDQIPNIDNVKAEIRAYYGATNGIANKTASPYVSQMTRIATKWTHRLTNICAKGVRAKERPAVVFDADDTTLMTYDMEDGAMKFNFDPTLQNTWVQEGRFPATPKMPGVVGAAARAGCKIVGLTGRNNSQRLATLDNLARYYHDADGDPRFTSAYYFTKWTSTDTPPAYVDCGLDGDDAKCSTIDYKASTRKYVQDELGLHIVANFGDQFSDLIGGSSDRAVKLPNPTYYLP